MTELILATTSPFRKRLFETLGIDFICEGSDVDEYTSNRPESAPELVKYLSRLKAEAVAKNHDSGIIVGFDSVAVYYGGTVNNPLEEILEKPKSREEDFNRLKKLSGRVHYFYTGIHMINLDNKKTLSDVVETKAFFRKLNDKEIEKYLSQDPMFKKCALGYAPPEYYSSTFVKRIEGSPHNLFWGMPVERIMPMLFEIGYELK